MILLYMPAWEASQTRHHYRPVSGAHAWDATRAVEHAEQDLPLEGRHHESFLISILQVEVLPLSTKSAFQDSSERMHLYEMHEASAGVITY